MDGHRNRIAYQGRACLLALFVCVIGLAPNLWAQTLDRVSFNKQELFLSGGNVAWVNFARDVGPGFTNLPQFEDVFAELQANGGNTLRFWLHTNGAATPAWSGNTVVGPGNGTLEDLRAILDLAWEHEIGLMLTLWSHDMLRFSFGAAITDRNKALLSDPDLLQSYIDNALIPMVEAVRGHPAIVAWEIFNEPEGMSTEHGWQDWDDVPMADFQRAINRMAGAIKRADPTAQVTNGAAGMSTTTDATASKRAAPRADELSWPTRTRIREQLSAKYDHPFTQEAADAFYNRLTSSTNYNYYTDERLIDAGGDPDGTLDFYTMHYYDWAGTSLSPFHHPFSTWNLDKPMVVAEFFLPDFTFGIPWDELYPTLYDLGYAGALGWQWFDVNRPGLSENWPRILSSTQYLFDTYPWAVDVLQPGPNIIAFTADPPVLEVGVTTATTLTWDVVQASTVTLDGAAVSPSGTQTVDLTTTTTFTLVAVDTDGLADTSRVTVEVLESSEINRALGRPAFASASETCCGNVAAARSFDGNPNTRWSSPYADNQWLYVDLGTTYDIERIVLEWETAFGRDYDLQVSYDAQTWHTIMPVRNGDGGTDEHVFAQPAHGRYVRMYGLTRGTQWGFSLWEFGVYGRVATQQPPTLALTSPTLADEIDPGQSIVLTADASDADGRISAVSFYQDGNVVATLTTAPYTYTLTDVPEGDYTFFAEATDNDGLTVRTAPITISVFVHLDISRYETEDGDHTGTIAVQSTDTNASGGRHVSVNRGGSTVTWTNVMARADGDYLLSIVYRLPLGPASQRVTINGVDQGELSLNQAGGWQTATVTAPLRGGVNTVTLEAIGGWVYLDYLEIQLNIGVANEPGYDLPMAFELGTNYPNPFNPTTTIPYRLGEAAHVQLDVVDLTGRHIATLVDGYQPAGHHTVRFEALHLASGIYLYRLLTRGEVDVHRMTLIK